MVYFKVTDGVHTRKFQVTPEQLTFDQLKDKIAALFPEAVKETSDLILQYRDADGDLITLSSNEEFQEALKELPGDYVWKLHICHSGRRPPSKRMPVMDHMMEPFMWPFGMSWAGYNRQMQEAQRDLDNFVGALQGLTPSLFGSAPTLANKEGEVEKMEEEQQKQSEEEVKSKKDSELSLSGSTPGCPACRNIQIKTFGSREPTIIDGPFGQTRIMGPVGYHITWSPKAQDEDCKSCNPTAATSTSATSTS